MKNNFIVLVCLVLLLSSQIVLATAREYRNTIKSANWTVKSKPQDSCVISQDVLNFGKASFSKRSGHELLFKLNNNESITNDIAVDVFIESLPWHHDYSSNRVGQYQINQDNDVLTIKDLTAHRLFQQLELGKVLVFQFLDKEIQKELFKFYVSPLKIRDNTPAFKECLVTLFEYDPDFIKDFIVYFDYNKHDLNADAKKNLSYVADHLKVDQSLIQVRIDAHADSIGRRRFNDRLSQKRADAVKEFLISKGVNVEMIYIKAHGERNPQYENDTAEGRSKNRHAQIQLLTTPPPPPDVKVKVVEEPKPEDFKPTDSGSTPLPNFINLDHLINR